MSFENDTTEEHERRIVRCKSCRAQIIWLPTPEGRATPIDADTVEPDDEEYEHGRHVSHFTTCTQQRKPR